MPRRFPLAALAVAACLLAWTSGASATVPAAAIDSVMQADYSPAMRNFVVLTMLSLIPVLLIGMTSFTRIVIVLSLLRHAIGLPQTPPNSVVVTLAVCLTYFSMSPVLGAVNANAVQPYMEHRMSMQQAIDVGSVPVRRFMISQTRESDLRAVLEMAHAPAPRVADDIAFSQLMPAFLLSELKTAFQIGFVIFLPFLLIDLVVGAVLMALGMIMVPPATLSLPLKILLFVLIDGWVLVSKALLASYWN
jgi:flagellar biosynthetic protein FliP